MADRATLERALRNAHAAGDRAAAQRLAAEIKNLSSGRDVRGEFDQLSAPEKAITALSDILRIGADNLTFGGIDHVRTLLGTQPDLETARQEAKDARTRAGGAGDVAAIGGAMLPAMMMPVVSAPAHMGGLSRGVVNSAIAGLEGAGFAGLDALGHGENVQDAQISGAITGILSNAGSRLMGKGMDALFERQPKGNMTPYDLRLARDRAYNAMEDEGVAFRPSAVDDLVDNIKKDTKDAWPGISDAAIGARKRAERNLKSGGRGFQRNRSLTEIDMERQNIRTDVVGRPEKAEKRQGQKMVKAIDDWLDRAGTDPSMITNRSGDPAAAMDQLLEGRALNTRVEKLDLLDERVGKARRQAERNLYSGEDSTLKTNIGGILDNPKLRSQFNAAELEQMNVINRGTPSERVLRQLGRFAPGGGLGFYGATAAGGLGAAALGGPAGIALGLAPAGVGLLAKGLSARATSKEAEKLLDMVSSGKSLKKTPHLNAESQRQLARILMMMGITSEED